jgi:hypothetical protein
MADTEINGGHLTADSSADIEKLTDMIYQLLNVVWKSNWGLFTDENPTGNNPDEIPLPHITYNLVHRTHTKGRTVKQTQFDSFPDEENPGHNITMYRTWFTCVMEFCMYAATRKEATRLAQRFEEFMETYNGYFKSQGISEIVFMEELIPTISANYRQDIPHRTVRYEVRIERITSIRSAHLKQVLATINVGREGLPATPEITKSKFTAIDGSPDFMKLYGDNFPN